MDIKEHIQKKHENIVVALGVGIGLILLGYFFTYAMLTDKGNTSLLWFEGLSSLLMVAVLIKIKKVAYWLLKYLFLRGSQRQIAEDVLLNNKK